MDRFDRRQGFLASALIHLLAMSLLLSTSGRDLRLPLPEPAETPEVRSRVFLPPPAALAEVMPRPAPPPAPRPVPTPPPPPTEAGKDRISVGAPSDRRAERLILRREDDLTQVPKGTREGDGADKPQVAQAERQPAPQAAAQPTPFQVDGPESRRAGGLRLPLPPGDGKVPVGPPRDASARPLSSAVQESLERRMRAAGPAGLATGTGRQMGPLFFDDQGADFTAWFNHFKNEVYRNWIVPQAAMMGFLGHVDITFTLDRAGKITDLRIVKSSGTPSLDRAAQNALLGSQLLALPADYAPPSVTMAVTFYYGDGPVGS